MYIMNVDGSNLKCVTSNLDQTPSSPFWSSNSLGVYFNVRDLVKAMYIMQISKGM